MSGSLSNQSALLGVLERLVASSSTENSSFFVVSQGIVKGSGELCIHTSVLLVFVSLVQFTKL